MFTRSAIVLLLMLLLVTAAVPNRSVHSILLTEGDVAVLNTTTSRDGSKEDKKGNGLVGVLKAPFKAIGRLFGGGKKEKLARLSEKDVKQFETKGLARINDA